MNVSNWSESWSRKTKITVILAVALLAGESACIATFVFYTHQNDSINARWGNPYIVQVTDRLASTTDIVAGDNNSTTEVRQGTIVWRTGPNTGKTQTFPLPPSYGPGHTLPIWRDKAGNLTDYAGRLTTDIGTRMGLFGGLAFAVVAAFCALVLITIRRGS